MAKPILPLVSDADASEPVTQVYGMLKQAFGDVPPLARIIANSAEMLGPFMGFAGATFREDHVALPYKELATMRVTELNGCNYCREWHSPLLDKMGIVGDKREGLGAAKVPDGLFDEREATVLKLAEEMTVNVQASPEVVKKTRELFGDAGALELMMTIGAYNLINRLARSCELTTVNP